MQNYPLSLWIIPDSVLSQHACPPTVPLSEKLQIAVLEQSSRCLQHLIHTALIKANSVLFSARCWFSRFFGVLPPFLSLACYLGSAKDTVCLFHQQVHFLCLLQRRCMHYRIVALFILRAYIHEKNPRGPTSITGPRTPHRAQELASSVHPSGHLVNARCMRDLYTSCIHTSRVDG